MHTVIRLSIFVFTLCHYHIRIWGRSYITYAAMIQKDFWASMVLSTILMRDVCRCVLHGTENNTIHGHFQNYIQHIWTRRSYVLSFWAVVSLVRYSIIISHLYISMVPKRVVLFSFRLYVILPWDIMTVFNRRNSDPISQLCYIL